MTTLDILEVIVSKAYDNSSFVQYKQRASELLHPI